MNVFVLLPVIVAILEGGFTSTYPAYLYNRHQPTGYQCSWSAVRYGRDDVWLVRVNNLSVADYNALAARPDVYVFPLDADLDSPISDKARIDAFFEQFRIPTNWTTPSTTYRQLLKALVNMSLVLQRYYGIRALAGTPEELFSGGVTLETKFSALTVDQRAALQKAVNELAETNVPINPNMTLRQLLKAASDYLQTIPVIVGGFAL